MNPVLQRSLLRRSISALLVSTASLAAFAPIGAQVVRVGAEENFRLEPNGVLLATLAPDTELDLVETRDTWVRATLEGWVWEPSLQTTERNGFDLVVAVSGGENLRERPRGRVLGRLSEGTLLDEIERTTGWIRVRRTGWIWRASVEIEEPTVAAAGAGEGAANAPDAAGAARLGVGDALGLLEGAAVLTVPEGDTLLRVVDPAGLSVVESREGWARVRAEGWVRVPEGSSLESLPPSGVEGATPGPGGPTLEEVRANPRGSRGAIVTWELQTISLERADPGRVEFSEGEPYLLMRPADVGTGRFVYVTIPESSVQDAEKFAPLERFVVRARVRMGASPITGGPVIELIEMTRSRGSR